LHLDLTEIVELLKEFTREKNKALGIILIGGLALHHYGLRERKTVDIDAEVNGDVEGLFRFLKSKKIPSDIGENISGWSVINLPPLYRKRALPIYNDKLLTVKVLHPLDFIVAKLRRCTDEDLEDALFVARKFGLKKDDIRKSANNAIKNSPVDTALFIFRKNVDLFLEKMITN